jgi:hypothetical protein
METVFPIASLFGAVNCQAQSGKIPTVLAFFPPNLKKKPHFLLKG